MNQEKLKALVEKHLEMLSVQIGPRPVGSANNKKAQAYIVDTLSACGLEVTTQSYDCLDWQFASSGLWCADSTLPVRANPFSPPCELTAPFVAVSSLQELESSTLTGKIALLYNGTTQVPVAPQNSDTTVPPKQRVLELLIEKEPVAVIAVSQSPLGSALEDGTFPLPSVTIPIAAGKVLMVYKDKEVSLNISSSLSKSQAGNIIGRRPSSSSKKLILSAHLDTKHGSPGAIDNASGLAALLALAEIEPKIGLEFVALNGEEYYSYQGLRVYEKSDSWKGALGAVNIDGIGVKGEKTAISSYGCSQENMKKTESLLEKHQEMVLVEPWDQVNCKFFASHGIPSVALRAQGASDLVDSVIHTKDDGLYMLSPSNIAATVLFVQDALQVFYQ
jgi:aminopeptidase YwaD